MNSVGDRMLLWGTPLLWGMGGPRKFFRHIFAVLLLRKLQRRACGRCRFMILFQSIMLNFVEGLTYVPENNGSLFFVGEVEGYFLVDEGDSALSTCVLKPQLRGLNVYF